MEIGGVVEVVVAAAVIIVPLAADLSTPRP